MNTQDMQRRHHEAMEVVDKALIAKSKGNMRLHLKLIEEAFQLENAAAALVAQHLELEPTRSILHRSAANLALQCEKFRAAEKLIATGLSGSPPDEIADELRDLLEQVLFARHLELRGIVLDSDELQLSLTGRETGLGIVHASSFISKEMTLERLLYRTIERKRGKPYQERGLQKKEIGDAYEVFMSVPRAASFAVTLKIGRPNQQLTIPGMETNINPWEALEELVDRLEDVQKNDMDGLSNAITDPAYRRNFLGLARVLAPDGKEIKQVGLTLVRANKQQRKLSLTKTKKEMPQSIPKKSSGESNTITGTLKYADDTQERSGKIKVIDADDKVHEIRVPEGMMNDIVRPLWGSEVIVDVSRSGKINHFLEIRKSDE